MNLAKYEMRVCGRNLTYRRTIFLHKFHSFCTPQASTPIGRVFAPQASTPMGRVGSYIKRGWVGGLS